MCDGSNNGSYTDRGTAGAENISNDEVYVFPTSYAQKQIWFIHQLNEESPAYSIPLAYRLRGELNVDALRTAVNEIIRRHETFRTTFMGSENGPLQVVHPTLSIDVPVMEMFAANEIQDFIDRETIRPFSLAHGPLIRAAIIRCRDGVTVSKKESGNEGNFIFFLNIHHIILDHISLIHFSKELSACYASYASNLPHSLKQPTLHHADYAVWQNKWQSAEKLSEKLDFWVKDLKGKAEYLNLPQDLKRPIEQTMDGAEVHFSLPRELTEQAKQFARAQGVSLFVLLLTTYNIVLARYARQGEISVGVPFANRSHQPELEEIMGCFISMVPVQSCVASELVFLDLLHAVRKKVLAVNAHQEVPFELIVGALQPKRDPSFNPIFQVGFTFQESPLELSLANLQSKSLKLHNQSSKFDFYAWLWEADGQIRGLLEYNTNIFLSRSAEQFVNHFEHLLGSIISNPKSRIAELSMMSEDEKRRTIHHWNQTAKNFDSDELIHELFESQAVRQGDKIAIRCGDNLLSYRDLDDKSNQLANYILAQKCPQKSLIAISVERSIDMLISCLAVLKSGASYIFLDPAYPKDRIDYMLENSKTQLLLASKKHLAVLNINTAITCICIDDEDKKIWQGSNQKPAVEITPDDLAYVIYTSGSTGVPKGVKVHHAAVVNFLNSMSNKPGLNESDTLLAITTLSFDISVLELYLPLSVGASVVIASTDEAEDGEDLMDLLDDHAITVMQATPATWQMLLSSGWEGNKGLKALCGGEALSRDLVKKLFSKVGQLWNMYGPTETTVWSSCFHVEDDESAILIGSPIANTEFYVLDQSKNPVPIGVCGELYIGGKGVTQGYLGLESLTHEKFVPNNFKKNEQSMYRTGDLVKAHESGEIEYFQRLDNQMKVRGYRIEPEEIEAVLLKQPGILRTVVVSRQLSVGDSRLIAYIVVDPELSNTMTTTSLRQDLREFLPDYMLPQHVIELSEIPLTANGKVDRNSLPEPVTQKNAGKERKLATTHAETCLVEIWSVFLNLPIEEISIHDNFFDLGGHSLLSIQVNARIKQITGEKLNPRIIILNSLEYMARECGFVPDSNFKFESLQVNSRFNSRVNKQ